MTRPSAALCAALIALPGVLAGQDAAEVRIRLENGTRAETQMAEELRDLLRRYDTGPWTLTRDVRIDETSIPHSHPVLTIHTRHLGDAPMLLATYLHEQLHWLEEARPGPWQAAMAELQALYPDVPDADAGGARDAESTWRHLLVCDMELQALTAHLGRAEAEAVLRRMTHYEWIYARVLTDPRVREVALRHGFDVARGADPGPAEDAVETYREDLAGLTRDGSWWHAANAPWREADGGIDAWGIRHWTLPGGLAARGCMWSEREGTPAAVHWWFFQGWDGAEARPFLYQVAESGITGFGAPLHATADSTVAEQRFRWDDGRMVTIRHATIPVDADTHRTRSSTWTPEGWADGRSYTWRRMPARADLPCGPAGAGE